MLSLAQPPQPKSEPAEALVDFGCELRALSQTSIGALRVAAFCTSKLVVAL